MAVFRYEATKTVGLGYTEPGIIVALDEKTAKAKLNQYGFHRVRLKRIRGMSALWKRFSADIK